MNHSKPCAPEYPNPLASAKFNIKNLTAAHAHLVTVGMENSRAADSLRREIVRRLTINDGLSPDNHAALMNADFNPEERRDDLGKWTTGNNPASSKTNNPTQPIRETGATNHVDTAAQDDDDLDNLPLSYGELHAKLRRSQSQASAQLYNQSKVAMKTAAAVGRVAAESNPVVGFADSAYQAATGKDAIDSQKQLTTAERWKSLVSALLTAGPAILKSLKFAKVLSAADEAADSIKGVKTVTAGITKATGEASKTKTLADSAEAIAKAGQIADLTDEEIHHIATAKNWISTARGGPWSPRFDEMFKKAGMTLKDDLNKVRVPGHYGPHPEEYHKIVYGRLKDSTKGLSGKEYTKAFRAELVRIGRETQTPGTKLNRLVTQ